jgi:hypothetical protein
VAGAAAAGNVPVASSTRLLMTLSAALNAALGVAASFMPQEILHYAGASVDPFSVSIIQLAGALYIGFALLNWSARGALLGGIYGRPIGLANFAHFAIAAIMLAKLALDGERAAALLGGTVVYAIAAVWFGLVVFGSGPKLT